MEKRRQDDLSPKEIAEMHKQTYLRSHPRAQEPVEEPVEEEEAAPTPISKLPEVQSIPEPEPDGEKEVDYSLDILEHRDKAPQETSTTDTKIKLDIVERIANPTDNRLIEMSEIPDSMVIPMVLLILQKAAADLHRTKPLGQIFIEAYAIVMRARNRKLILDLQKLFQTQVDKEVDATLPGMNMRG